MFQLAFTFAEPMSALSALLMTDRVMPTLPLLPDKMNAGDVLGNIHVATPVRGPRLQTSRDVLLLAEWARTLFVQKASTGGKMFICSVF